MASISRNTESLFGKDPSKLPFLSPAACVLHYLLSHCFGLGWGSVVPGDGDYICDGLTHVGPMRAPVRQVTAQSVGLAGTGWLKGAER